MIYSFDTERSSLDAVCSAYWYWIYFDSIELKRMEHRNVTELDKASIKRICDAYSVQRTIKKKDLSKVQNIINNLSHNWPDTLLERSIACENAAQGINSDKAPRSAVTKLIWFLQPPGCTLFDSYAARGIGIRNKAGHFAMNEFYRRLSEAKFEDLSQQLRKSATACQLPLQIAERTIDWLLMYRGERKTPCFGDEWTNAFLATLTNERRKALCKFAKQTCNELDAFRPGEQ